MRPITLALPRRQKRRDARHFVRDGWRRWLALNATELKWTGLVIGGMVLAGFFT